MRFGPKAAWLLCFAWCAWLTALAVYLEPLLGGWTPDLALVLIASLILRSGRAASLGLVYCLVYTRLAFSLDPPAALAAGGWMLFLLVRSVAHLFDADQMLARAGAAFGAALLLGVWLFLAAAVRGAGAGSPGGMNPLMGILSGAAATGACALILGPLFAALPGLGPLRRQA